MSHEVFVQSLQQGERFLHLGIAWSVVKAGFNHDRQEQWVECLPEGWSPETSNATNYILYFGQQALVSVVAD